MLRISALTRYDFPYFGPMESFLRMLALGVTEIGSHIDIIRFSGDMHKRENDLQIPIHNYLTSQKVKQPIFRVIVFILKWLMIPFFVLRCKYKLKADVLLIVGFDSALMLVPILFWCKIVGLKSTRVITEIFPDQYIVQHWYEKPNLWLHQTQIRYVDRYFDGIIVLSTHLRELLISHKVNADRIILIPHFINLNQPGEVKTDSTRFRIGYCGAPNEINGIIDLCDAVFLLPDRIKNIELVILGKVTKSTHEIIRKHKPTSQRRILITGRITTDKVHPLLLQCDVLVNPRKRGISAESGFPTKVGEYFAARRPVITTRCGDLTLYIEDKKEVFFAEPDSPESLAQNLIFIHDHKDLAEKVAINGYNWARNNLDYRTNAQKLVHFLEHDE